MFWKLYLYLYNARAHVFSTLKSSIAQAPQTEHSQLAGFVMMETVYIRFKFSIWYEYSYFSRLILGFIGAILLV